MMKLLVVNEHPARRRGGRRTGNAWPLMVTESPGGVFGSSRSLRLRWRRLGHLGARDRVGALHPRGPRRHAAEPGGDVDHGRPVERLARALDVEVRAPSVRERTQARRPSAPRRSATHARAARGR